MKMLESAQFEKFAECPPLSQATPEFPVPGKLTDTFEFCVPIVAALLK
jgi:hypothetical protein